MNTTQQTTPKIYVACLAAYNNGRLHGAWIEASQDAENIHEDIQKMLKNSPEPFAEEWAIHDYEGFEGLQISEYESIEDVARYAQLIEDHGEAYVAYAGYIGTEYATEEGFEEAYQGEWDSEEAFAENLADETMEIPEHLQYYIDYEKFARDLFINDYFSVQGESGQLYVFRHI
ncbi:MAG: antirestriction protein ArdA [Candidatus Omnitrophica bacterium]|nr:antirestriction protein ArdA [Candidatus Omnitrophota bacterium]